MNPEQLPAVLQAMRQLEEQANQIVWSYAGRPLDVNLMEKHQHRLMVAAVSGFPALIDHAADIIARHKPGGPLCNWCTDAVRPDLKEGQMPWPCPEITSICAALSPYEHL